MKPLSITVVAILATITNTQVSWAADTVDQAGISEQEGNVVSPIDNAAAQPINDVAKPGINEVSVAANSLDTSRVQQGKDDVAVATPIDINAEQSIPAVAKAGTNQAPVATDSLDASLKYLPGKGQGNYPNPGQGQGNYPHPGQGNENNHSNHGQGEDHENHPHPGQGQGHENHPHPGQGEGHENHPHPGQDEGHGNHPHPGKYCNCPEQREGGGYSGHGEGGQGHQTEHDSQCDDYICSKHQVPDCKQNEWLWTKCPTLCGTCKCQDLDPNCHKYLNQCTKTKIRYACRQSCGICISSWGNDHQHSS